MRRLLRVTKFGLLGLFGLIGIGLIGLAIANAPVESQINERIIKLQAANEPVSIEDLGKDPPKPTDNAATYLDLAEADCLAIQRQVSDAEEQELRVREKAGNKLTSLPDDDPVLIEIYRAALAAHPKAIELLELASDCSRYHLNVNYKTDSPTAFVEEMLKKLQTERAAMRTLNYQIRLLMAEGKPAEALDTGLVMLRLSNLYGQAPSLVGHLVAIACRNVTFQALLPVLQSDQLPPNSRRRLETALADWDIRDSYRESFRTERAVGLSHFEDEIPEGYSGLPHGKQDKLSYLELMEVLIAHADDSGRAKLEMQPILERAGVLTKLLAPAIQATGEAVTRNEAQIRCLRILNALLARDPSESEDISLGDLGLPAEVTTDPFNGKPLNLRNSDQGWVIYSVGKDMKDDGGKLDDELTDVGFGPARLEKQ